MNQLVGRVYLVGAGPGDPGLLTLRGAEYLRRADVVLYDYLVNPRVLDCARKSAEIICLGQHGHTRIWSQQEINERLVDLARAGKTVVRLKGGDPGIFARGTEELAFLAAAQIPYEIVPGVTAALAASAYAGIPLTDREHASAVAFVTGQEDAEKDAGTLDYAALAAFPGTLVFYMGITTVRHWSTQLLAAGKPPDTPTVVLRRCSFPDQRSVYCRLDELADRIQQRPKIRPPAIVIVGPVANQRETLSWFEQRPLFGQCVLVTRPRDQAGELAVLLEEQGAEVMIQPAIDITPPSDMAPVDRILARLAEFDWMVFSSANGVRFLFEHLWQQGYDLRSLSGLKLAAIGSGTAETLTEYHLRPDLVPDEYRAEALAAALTAQTAGKKVLLIRASRGREVLADQLQSAGALVEQVVVYQSSDVPAPDQHIVSLLREGKIDWLTVTSSAIAKALVRLFGEDLRHTKLVSISPVTSETLRGMGFEPAAEASPYTMMGIRDAILKNVGKVK